MKQVSDLSADELLDELGIAPEPVQLGGYTPRQERLLAGFEDIVRFRETHGRTPLHGEQRDIFERIYAVRLDQLRGLPDADRELLREIDRYSLLRTDTPASTTPATDDDLLQALGIADLPTSDISTLRHVEAPDARRIAAHEVADRTPCKDFDTFKPLFDQVQHDLETDRRQARPFSQDEDGGATIRPGDFFILQGHVVYVAELGDTVKAPNGASDARLRVIYANGTESNLLRRSLQRALNKDDAGRRITQPDLGPLFTNSITEDDIGTGTIYVLRSLSKQPHIVALGDVLHKVGVTSGPVEERIANAELDATYLMAPVQIIATWTLANVHRFRLEKTLHRVFAAAQIDLTIPDRFGHPVKPREWFLVPLPVIDEAVQKIIDGSIVDWTYDPQQAALIRR